ncbi:hypothetical protein ACJIZ3_009304 [Penstemon smallii]|uniref:F-box domain-containing protein n=1 Tax=Penstemon smallii TaxID=265156 RepID=A0ABD3TDV8_9LAMI
MSGENPFNRLPEDVIIYIFDKIADAKSLCICTLVSKKMCYLVLQTKTVSVEISSWIQVCSCHRDPAAAKPLLRNLLHFLGKPVTSLWRLLKQPFTTPEAGMIPDFIPIIQFLIEFSCVESLTIKMGFSKQTSFEPLVKWKYDKSGFIFICAKGVCLNSSENNNDVLAPPSTAQLMSLVLYHLMDAMLRLNILKATFRKFPELKNVLVMDSLNQGRVVMDEDGIASLRDGEEPFTGDHDDKFCVKLWHENVLHLPGSGRVMKEVTVAMFKEIDSDDDNDDCLMMFENGFEEKEYREMSELMVKKRACFEDVVSSKQLMKISIVIFEVFGPDYKNNFCSIVIFMVFGPQNHNHFWDLEKQKINIF